MFATMRTRLISPKIFLDINKVARAIAVLHSFLITPQIPWAFS